MGSIVNETLPGSMVDVILNGVATSIKVEIDDSRVKAGYVHVEASTHGFPWPRNIRVTCAPNGRKLQVVVDDLKNRPQPEPARTAKIHVKNTGPARADGGIANTGVLATDELVGANTGVRIHGKKQDATGRFSETRESGVLRQVSKPQLSLTFTVCRNGLEYRISD